MALLGDAFGNLGGAVLIGIGAALVAPLLLPAAGNAHWAPNIRQRTTRLQSLVD